MILRLLALLPLLFATAAHASSPGAWAAFETKVARSCKAASGLVRARSTRPVGFDDTLGKVVILVSGLEGRTRVAVTKLCVFDQKTGRVWTAEAQGWRAPVR